ncbi:MAG: HlyD family efflux transporter periplasmic adaptor subunit [Rhodobacteraceae bacterium]|nr:HlyD family efflux transporter periplasmic adaptor subunit [Paracoccaceae bacterium]
MSFVCTIPILGALFAACLPPLPLATGYVEGEYILIAPVEVAQINHIAVRRGDHVAIGDEIAVLERSDAEIAVAQAEAALSQAQSNLANISQGRRPAEIAVIEASLASARAQEVETARELERQSDLLARDIAPQARVDQADTQHKIALARVGELEANLRVATLPAREDEIRAAEASVRQAEAVAAQARWRLGQRTLVSLVDGTVTDVLRSAGEVAGPQAPILEILPDGAVRLRLYVAEARLSDIALGTRLRVSCDGCAGDITAEVSYIAPGPEFTPPVIYSLENRQKLVFLIEARPADNAPALKPGQIVQVDLIGPAR